MATYYMRADGDASITTWAAAVGPASDPLHCMNLNKANNATMNSLTPGDTVILSGLGGIFRTGDDAKNTFQPRQSGSANNWIKYQGQDNAILCAASLITGWTLVSGNVWRTTSTRSVRPLQVFMDDHRGQEVVVTPAAEYEWYWDATNSWVHVYSPSGDPSTYYSTRGVEITDSTSGTPVTFSAGSMAYNWWDNLTIEKSQDYGINHYNFSQHGIRITNCTLRNNYFAANRLLGNAGTSFQVQDVLIEDCIGEDNGGHGIMCGAWTLNAIVRRNIARRNCHYLNQILPGEAAVKSAHEYLGNLKFTGDRVEGLQVYENIAEEANTTWPIATRSDGGNGIWTDVSFYYGGKIYRNIVRNNTGQGIRLEETKYVECYNNLVINNGTYGIAVSGNYVTLRPAQYNKVYNNTVVGGTRGIQCTGDFTDGCIYNEVYNNIAIGWTSWGLYADGGGDNEGSSGYGNRYFNNVLLPGTGGDGYRCTDTTYADIDDWETAINALETGSAGGNVETDPKLYDVTNEKYWLSPDSPCRNAGVDLGSTYDPGLNYRSTWPSGVTTASRDAYGHDIGAYVYDGPVTYYIRADGTAVTKEAATSDASAATAMNVINHNAIRTQFHYGDRIIISDAGGLYWHAGTPAALPLEGLLVGSSGIAGHPITYQASGHVHMFQGFNKTGWVVSTANSNIFKVAQTNAPLQLFISNDGVDDDFLPTHICERHATADLAAEYEWLYDTAGTMYDMVAGMAYLWTGGGDPDTIYPRTFFTINNRNRTFDFGGQSYVTLDGIGDASNSLLLNVSYHTGVHHSWAGITGQVGLTVKNITSQWNQRNGIILSSGSGFTVEDCVARYNGKSGIYSALCTGAVTVHRNESYENGRYQDVAFDAVLTDTSGIGLWGNADASKQKLTTVEKNYVHDNGPVGGGPSGSYGVGIWVDSCNGVDDTNANIVRYNRVEDNEGNGIYVEKSFYSKVYGNIVARNGLNTTANGIYVDSKENKDCSYNKVYGNSVYGNYVGIRCVGDSVDGGAINYNEFKNNIVSGNTSREFWANSGGDNQTYGTGNRYVNNCAGAEAAGFIYWAGTTYATYAAWVAAANAIEAGTVSANVEGDPLFEDPGSDQFWLQTGSPCLDAGVDLGDEYKWALHPDASWPDGVLTMNLDVYGWNAGAYGHIRIVLLPCRSSRYTLFRVHRR